jgi:uncharacterized protein YecT (DUF1311 family)
MRLSGPIFAIFLASALPVFAQDVDCSDAVTQADMNECAYLDWQMQDEDLNAVYATAMAAMTDIDAGLGADDQGAAQTLRQAQRAWVAFRDLACAAEGYQMRGGSAESMLVYGCLARLTEERVAHLALLAGDY